MKNNTNKLTLLNGLSYEGGRVGVLLIHSLGGTPLELKYVAQGYAREGYAVECPMLPGMTNGTDVLSLSRWQDWYAEVERVFDELSAKCDTVFVGGLSAGSILALKLAKERPGEIAGLLAFAPTLWPNGWAIPWTFNFYRLVHTRWFARLFRLNQRAPYGIKDERIRKFMTDAFKSENRSIEEVYARPGVMVLEFCRLVRSVMRDVGSIKVPTFIAHPREDDQSDLRNALKLQRKLAGPVESVILDDCYHVVTLDRQRDIVLERSLDFTARLLARIEEEERRTASTRRSTANVVDISG
ncbi:MAG: alpha/beta fold hydrolase [Alphaproteobacteria bacterium]|nr:alpha/beta fold hydrolase [Alphaproteobacteria bacterium]